MVPKSPDCRIQEISITNSTTAEKRAKKENCQFSTKLRFPTQIYQKYQKFCIQKVSKAKNRKYKTQLKQGKIDDFQNQEFQLNSNNSGNYRWKLHQTNKRQKPNYKKVDSSPPCF